jgi:hypothetical protein
MLLEMSCPIERRPQQQAQGVDARSSKMAVMPHYRLSIAVASGSPTIIVFRLPPSSVSLSLFDGIHDGQAGSASR